MRNNDLKDSANDAAGATVTYARVTPRDILCEGEEMTVTCYPFTGSAWTESTAQWSNLTQSWDASMGVSLPISYSKGLEQPTDHWYRFEITELVQKWINGEADPALGIIFKANSTVEDGSAYLHKTFGSYERSGYKPWFTMTYYPTAWIEGAGDVDEGDSITLRVRTSEGLVSNVSWQSSDTSVATVNSVGVVTGIRAGVVTITASSEEIRDNVTFTVYVCVADGVYYIKNMHTSLYLQPQKRATWGAMVIQNEKYDDSQSTADHILQMWKIKYLGAGYYSIRTMHKLDFGMFGSPVFVGDEGTIDSLVEVEEKAQWIIRRDSVGYIISNRTEGEKVLQIVYGTALGSVARSEPDTNAAISRWELVGVEDPPTGVLLYTDQNDQYVPAFSGLTVSMKTGETKRISNWNLKVVAYSGTDISQAFRWTSSNPMIATVNETNGEITAMIPGRTVITATSHSNNQTVSITVDVELADGVYYIQNAHTKMYAGEYDWVDTNNGYAISQNIFDGVNTEKWVFERTDDGYYVIWLYDVSSSTERFYLSSRTNSFAFVFETTTIEDDMKFSVSTTDSGTLKVVPKLYANKGLSTYGRSISELSNYVYFDEYTNDQYRQDEWLLHEVRLILEVELEGQQDGTSCWLACARMVAKYYYPGVTKTQAEAERAVNDHVALGTFQETCDAIDYYISDIPNAELDMVQKYGVRYSEANLLRFLDDGHVLIAYMDAKEENSPDHLVVIVGYKLELTDDGVQFVFVVADPDPIGKGEITNPTYEQLCTNYDAKYRWTGVIVMHTDYVDETEPVIMP